MKRRRSPREVIESVDSPRKEEVWIKMPSEEPIPISTKRKRTKAEYDPNKIEEKRGVKPMFIHTHPSHLWPMRGGSYLSSLLSASDLYDFLADDKKKTAVVAETGKDGKLMGYLMVRKTKKTPSSKKLGFGGGSEDRYGELLSDLVLADDKYALWGIIPPIWPLKYLHRRGLDNVFNEFAQKYHLNYRFVPAPGSDLYKGRKPRRRLLEESLQTASVILLICAFFSSVTILTGSVITIGSVSLSSFDGLFFFLIGISLFFLSKLFHLLK